MESVFTSVGFVMTSFSGSFLRGLEWEMGDDVGVAYCSFSSFITQITPFHSCNRVACDNA